MNMVIGVIVALIAAAIFVGGIAWWDWETSKPEEGSKMKREYEPRGTTIVESPDARVIEIITSLEKQVAALRTEIGAMATTIAMMAQVISKNTSTK